MKIFELNNKKLVCLILISHASLLGILFFGNIFQIATTILISVLITLLASTVTYHRLLSHRSWNAPRWYEIFGTLLGIFSFTGSSISRTAVHRMHHAYVDTEKDPHSPKHVGRFFVYFPIKNNNKINPRLVSDLLRDPIHKFVHHWYLAIILLTFLSLYFLCGIWWAISLSIAPGALCWLSIAILNIAGHSVNGYPIDNGLVSWLTFGEGNHKYHHDHPNDPNIGQGSFDPGYAVIKLLKNEYFNSNTKI